MMLNKGHLLAREALSEADLQAAQRLRWLAFMGKHGAVDDGMALDVDDHDPACRHILIEDQQTDQLLATFRFLHLSSGAEIGRSYAARHYNLDRLRDFEGPMVEMGRFCTHPERTDPDILRLAWGVMTRYVDDHGIRLLFGCSSFAGTDTQGYADAFALLRAQHLAPPRWLPRVKAPKVFRFASALRRFTPDPKRAKAELPPLLRTYLIMGGWVSDHAVVDEQLNTLHVFTGLEIAAIPQARQKLLRAVAG